MRPSIAGEWLASALAKAAPKRGAPDSRVSGAPRTGSTCASGCHPHACNRVTNVYAITQFVAVVWGLARSMP
eukprot:590571-Alexandrium_andersonii.AAC.1